MSSLPDNTELRQRLASLYLGDANIASKAVWVYAKARRCHVLCLHGINKTTLNPTPVVLHGIFTLARHPFKLVPDGGFLESTAELYFGHTPLHEAMARTNAWARLEKVHDKDLLGYNDFSQYIKNLKGFESLMHAGDSLQHSLVNDEGATGPQVKVIHRMFESCWDTIRVTTTPQQDIEAKLKMRYKLTPGDHPVAVRLANSKSPSCSGTVTPLDDPRKSLSCSETANALGEPPNLESVTLQTERTTPPTEPSTPENKAKALPELGGYDDSSDDESVHGFLGPEFGLEHWPVAPENIDLRDKMFEEKRWQTNPLRAYREGIEGVIAPSEYATALPGATVQMSFTLACHLIGSRTGKKTTFSARVEEIIILKKPATLVSNRTDSGSPSKRLFSGPSFSPTKRRKLEK